MMKLSVIGNLGADAEVIRDGGNVFVSLSIAHTERSKNGDGQIKETTQWISATINGDGGKLLEFLKKGTKIYAYGDMGLRLFHSEKDRMMKAGVNLYIRNIELIGANGDVVPKQLYDKNGIAHRIDKYYFCSDYKTGELYARSGEIFTIDESGWIKLPVVNNNDIQVQQEQNYNDNNTANEIF